MVKIHLIPAQIGGLANAQSMPVRNQDHRSVPIAPAVLARRLDQVLDLGAGQMFSGADLGISPPSWRDCPIFGGWGDDSEGWFHQRFSSWLEVAV
jgi:hypothetical protein